MKSMDDSLCQQIALGWAMQLLLKVAALLNMVVYAIVSDHLYEYIKWDPGESGLRFVVYQFLLVAALPIYAYAIRGYRLRAWRWVLVALATFALIFNILHHLMHWLQGARPDLPAHVMDVAIEMNLIWILISSIRWARLPQVDKPAQERNAYEPMVAPAGTPG